jgi:polysaccharide pyruvyl transferase WcaK-like protein
VKRVAYFGLFGAGNIGNEASLAAGLAIVGELLPGHSAIVVGAWPEAIVSQHGVPAVAISTAGRADWINRTPRACRLILRPITELARWVAAYRIARTVDVFVIPGTGILDDFGTRPHEMPYDLFRWSTAARLARRPWVMAGIGAGPITHPTSRWLMRQTARNSTVVTYRDEVSRAFMSQLDDSNVEAPVQPDIVFAVPREIRTRLADENPGPPKRVGIGLMTYYGWNDDPQAGLPLFDGYIAAMIEIAKRLVLDGHAINIITGQASDEVAVSCFLAGLDREIPNRPPHSVVAEPIVDFAGLLRQVDCCDVVIATRYHNVIASILTGKPVLAIGYADKFRDLMQSVQMGEMCRDIDEIDVDAVLADVAFLLSARTEIATQLSTLSARFDSLVRESMAGALGCATGILEQLDSPGHD